MTSAYILITAIIILGGLLAWLGDWLGSYIGKKLRWRIFNLRPRQSAIVITLLTGVVISASTLGLLFSLSKSLRQGVFELDKLLNERRDAIKTLEQDLTTATKARDKVEQELADAKTEQVAVQNRLLRINKDFKKSRSQLEKVSGQLKNLRRDIGSLLAERQQLVTQKNQLSGQISQLQTEIQARDKELQQRSQELAEQDIILAEKQARLQQLEAEQRKLQSQINQRDEQIASLDQRIAAKDESLITRENQLKELTAQLDYLKREVEVLEQYYQNYQELRERKIAILRGQVLSFGAFRLTDPEANTIINIIDEMLKEANISAIQATRPGSETAEERVVKITQGQVEQLIQQLQNGGEYVIRILSAGNYVLGEKEVRVFADVVPNQKIFASGQQIATVSIDYRNLNQEDIQKRLDILVSAAQFRARRLGVLGIIQIEDGNLKKVVDFIEQVNTSEEGIDELQAVASETTYTAGPLKLRLLALRNGKIVFST
jgi:uncharacterized protein (DUF3084 family)